MNITDLTVAVLVANTDLQKPYVETPSNAAGERKSLFSLLGNAARAVIRFWDRGGESVDALYASKFDAPHFLESNGVSVQYHGDATAFRPARTHRKAEIQQPYTTLRRITGADNGRAENAAELRRKAS